MVCGLHADSLRTDKPICMGEPSEPLFRALSDSGASPGAVTAAGVQ